MISDKRLLIVFFFYNCVFCSDYGIYAKNYDGDFVNLVLGLQAMLYLNDKNQLAISSSLSSQRAFLEPASPNSSNIKKPPQAANGLSRA